MVDRKWQAGAFAALTTGAAALAGAAMMLAQAEPASYLPPSGQPSVRLYDQRAVVTWSAAGPAYDNSATPAPEPRGPRLTALADGLNRDPDQIFRFVRDNIEFDPYFGLQKGAEGALVDRSANAFDQTALLVELMRASNIQARYVFGVVELGPEAAGILRADDARQACRLLAAGSLYAVVNGTLDCNQMSGAVSSLALVHAWAEVQIDGRWIVFDPSLKPHVKESGTDLWAAMGGTSAAIWNDVASGVGFSNNEVVGYDRERIFGRLNGYAAALEAGLLGDLRDRTLKGLAGGWTLVPTAATPQRLTALPHTHTVMARWEEVPTKFRAKLILSAGGAVHERDLPTVYADDLQVQMDDRRTQAEHAGQFFYLHDKRCGGGSVDPSPGSYSPAAGPCQRVAVATAAQWDRRVEIRLDHPYWNATQGTALGDQSVWKTMEMGRRADIVVRIGGASGDRYASHKAEVDPYFAHKFIPAWANTGECQQSTTTPLQLAPADPLSPPTSNCELELDDRYYIENNMGLFPAGNVQIQEINAKKPQLMDLWAAQLDRATPLLEGLSRTRLTHHHSLGIAYAPGAVGLGLLDIDSVFGVAPAAGGDAPHTVLTALATLSSAFEGAAAYKTFNELFIGPDFVPPGPDAPTWGAEVNGLNGFYGATHSLARASGTGRLFRFPACGAGSCGGRPPALTDDRLWQGIVAYRQAGFDVLGSATGSFYARRLDGSEAAWIMFHTGNADVVGSNGQSLDTTIDPDRHAYRKGAVTPNPIDYLGKAEGRQIAANVAPTQLGAVDLNSGALAFAEEADLTVGQGDFPYSLSFSRSYASGGSVAQGGGLGVGWTHNWASSVSVEDDPLARFPDAEPVAGAPTLTAMLIVLEAARRGSLEADLVGAAATSWWFKQTQLNVVQVSGGGTSARFVRKVGGEWRNPSDPAEQLLPLGGGRYRRTLADASVQVFGGLPVREQGFRCGSSGGWCTNESRTTAALKSWTFPSGVAVNLTYDVTPHYTGGPANVENTGTLTRVSNTVGATLAFYNQPAVEDAICKSMGLEECRKRQNSAGTLISVSSAASSVGFNYASRCEENSNLCFRVLIQRHQAGKRVRAYGYDGMDDYVLLSGIGDDGLPNAVAGFTWRVQPWLLRPHVVASTDAQNRATTYATTGAWFGGATDATGARHRRIFDADGRLVESIDPLSNATRAAYDAAGRTAAIVTPYGDSREFAYDARGNLVTYTRRPNQPADDWWGQTITVSADYHPRFNTPTRIQLPQAYGVAPPQGGNPDGLSYRLTYDGATGLLTTMEEPETWDGQVGGWKRPVWTTTYDTVGRVTRERDPTGREVARTYDPPGGAAVGCLRSQTEAAQAGGLFLKTDFTCNAVGDVLTTTDPRGAVTTAEYDGLRRKIAEIGPAGTNIRTETHYDGSGDPWRTRNFDDSAGVWRDTVTTFSPTHQPLTVTDPRGDLARTCYDALDRPVLSVDGERRASRTTYDPAGRAIRMERWLIADVAGDPCAVRAAPPPGQTTTVWREHRYDAGGHLTHEIDARGNTTQHVYEGLGRRIITLYPDPDGAGPQRADESWFLTNQRDQLVLHRLRGPAGSVNQWAQTTRDPLGRVYQQREVEGDGTAWPIGRMTRATHDLAGRRVYADVSLQTQSSGFDESRVRDVLVTGHDAAGRVAADVVYPEGTAGFSVRTDYGWDASGNRSRIQWSDGYAVDYRHDAAGRLQFVDVGALGGYSGGRFEIVSDSLGRRTQLRRPNGGRTDYGYAADSQLTSLVQFSHGPQGVWSTHTYGYDRSGRLGSAGSANPALQWLAPAAYARAYGAADGADRLTSEGSTTFGHDARGNLTHDGVQTYTYDLGSRLLTASRAGMSASYGYDPDDRRSSKTVNGVVTRTLWSGSDEIGELTASGAWGRRFVPGAGVDERLAVFDPQRGYTFPHTDRQGSVIGAADGADIVQNDITPYGPFGESAGPPPAGGGGFGYTGRQWDAETGLYYVRARYYSPRLGRFLQLDPMGTKDDPNAYLYVGNDPMNATDPTGKTVECSANSCRIEARSLGELAFDLARVGGTYIRRLVDNGAASAAQSRADERPSDAENRPRESDRPQGVDGKRGSTGGPGEGKRFPAEPPDVRDTKEGVLCRYCKNPTTNEQGRPDSREREHIDPRSRGGNNSKENEGDSCRSCNRSKGGRTPEEFDISRGRQR